MTTTPATIAYHVPQRPYNLVDAINRSAAATGSVGYARAAAHADYNGHTVTVAYNSYRRYYTAEYYWGERVVLARGTLAEAVAAALAYYDRGAKGAAVVVRVEAADAADPCLANPRLVAGAEKETPATADWRYAEVPYALRANREGVLLSSRTRAEYDAAWSSRVWVRLAENEGGWRWAIEVKRGQWLLWNGAAETEEVTEAEIVSRGIRRDRSAPGAVVKGAPRVVQLRGELSRALSARGPATF